MIPAKNNKLFVQGKTEHEQENKGKAFSLHNHLFDDGLKRKLFS